MKSKVINYTGRMGLGEKRQPPVRKLTQSRAAAEESEADANGEQQLERIDAIARCTESCAPAYSRIGERRGGGGGGGGGGGSIVPVLRD